ncbi:MAG TPA: recombinase family protein [Luteimonas sp.]
MKPKVYSYKRFSDPKQAAGGSADRQHEYAARWAAERGMALDESLTLFDKGLSAYHQTHVTRGALGTFLRAVEDGMVPTGSTLIVESLDRLSRAEPIVAQAQLAQIINAGITVVTAGDNREYSREGLRAQPMDLVYSLLVMIRAHEESETKSKRVKAAIRRQCQGWVAGTYRGVIRNGHDPDWVELVGGKYRLIPERVKALRYAVALFREGHGSTVIVRKLGEQGMTITASGNMAASHLYKLLRNRVLIGEKVIAIDGEEFQLQGYYPAALTPEEFAELQYEVIPRAKRMKRESEYPGVITGLGITYCGYCGGCIVAQNVLGRKRRADGHLHPGHMRIICHGNAKAVPCAVLGSCSVIPVERAVIAFCSDQLNLSRLTSGGASPGDPAALLHAARAEAAELQARIDRLTDALAEVGTSAALAKRLRETEDALDRANATVAAMEHDQRRASEPVSEATAAEWALVADGVNKLDADARIRARLLVGDTFSRITIFHRGLNPTEREVNESGNRLRTRKGTITVILTSKAGGRRILHIDRQSGEWQAMEDAFSLPDSEVVLQHDSGGELAPRHAREPRKPAASKRA